LIDPYDGQADLAARLLRAVGQPELRLAEDALRIMRALRFSSTLGFSIETELAHALHEQKQSLMQVSAERVQHELMRLLAGDNVLQVLLEYPDVLAVWIPEIAAAVGFDQKSPWHRYDVWLHTAYALASASAEDPLIRLTLLFHDLGKPGTFSLDAEGRGHFYGHAELGEQIARDRLTALRFDARTVKLVAELIKYHLSALKPESVRRWLGKLGEEQLRRLIEVKRGDMSSHSEVVVDDRLTKLASVEQTLDELIASDACFKLCDLAIDGDDLIALGMTPGPALGRMLDRLFDAVMDEELPNERASLLALAREWQEQP
jgi:tRNA nucleotidyltransferase (CCA-adding enzyme)